jgi:carbon storage regulator CsrA
MLVFQMKERDTIDFSDDVKVHVLKILKNKVRLGVEAPPDVSVTHREAPQGTKAAGSGPAVPPKAKAEALPLDPRHIEILNRLAIALPSDPAAVVSQRLLMQTVLEAVEEAGVDFGGCASLEEIKARLLQALRPKD